ncbi:hypothetical protein ACN38_g4069 [Penicillium nordicum]|uniref:Secreted protein n=1 Tax=Penicillium nordicum TaxID=229535 RepID=A0A0M8P419_9EURO|nr:hypothetical protein ACN38_g4069 [Penicillium nordicum]
MSLPLFRIISTLGVAATQAATLSKCSPFHPPKPELLGPSILDVQADEVHNHSAVSLGPGSNEERSTESVLATSQLHTLILVGTTQSTLRSGYHSGVGICHSKPSVVEVKGALTLLTSHTPSPNVSHLPPPMEVTTREPKLFQPISRGL